MILCHLYRASVKSVMETNALFVFCTSIFMNYDILTQYQTLIWFAMLVNDINQLI